MKAMYIITSIFLITSCRFFSPGKGDIPSFNVLLMDSTTYFNTDKIPSGNPTILLYFSPDCEHCQAETDSILHNMKYFKNVQFYFVTNDPIERIKVFNYYYKIFNYPNITLGQDYQFFFIKHFKPQGPPYLIIYDEDKKQRAIFTGMASTSKIIKFINTL